MKYESITTECELCKKRYKGHARNVHRGHHKSGYIKEDGSRNWDYSEHYLDCVDETKYKMDELGYLDEREVES